MTFSSISFFVFFFIVIIMMLLTKLGFLNRLFGCDKLRKVRHYILLVASYFFYGWWDWRFCFLMAFMTLIAYFTARNHKNKLNKILGVVVPLVVLGIFKYFNFFIESFTTLFNIENTRFFNIILPVGISFYTFQSMSYTIDVIRGKIRAASLLEVSLYISFFPQLVAGPIVKAEEFIPQLNEDRNITLENFLVGIQIFVFGLFKKIVIADHLSVFVDQVFGNVAAFSSVSVILAVISYSIQIYFDFSGYSDMAIGAAKCLGYDFRRNFNIPYVSKNVTEFWKRWHISLSSWLQEYLYIPLGGNRKGTIRTYINLLATMLLGGLWHGASVTFIVWGFLHGIALCIHKLYSKYIRKNKESSWPGKLIATVITYIFVCICWVFFRAETVGQAFVVLEKMFVFQGGIMQIYFWSCVAIAIYLISILAVWIRTHKLKLKSLDGFYPIMDLRKFWSLTAFFTFAGLILALAYTGANPFIYFQF